MALRTRKGVDANADSRCSFNTIDYATRQLLRLGAEVETLELPTLRVSIARGLQPLREAA